jgi:hypothetical protein
MENVVRLIIQSQSSTNYFQTKRLPGTSIHNRLKMATGVLLIIPPLIKYNAGPLLGPALLQAAARNQGHQCTILDLNAHWLHRHILDKHYNQSKPVFLGDHNKPPGNILSNAERIWHTMLLETGDSHPIESSEANLRRLKYAFLSHETIENKATKLAETSFGFWVQSELLQASENESDKSSPCLIGLSLLHGGQVVPAAAISIISRSIWPTAVIAWGGPHISGLGNAITQNSQDRRAFADIFVQGHAEETFVDILDQLNTQKSIWHNRHGPPQLLTGRRGKYMHLPLIPVFDNLDCYSKPVTLPAQSSLGCTYGKCHFCTYPAIEGKPVQLDLNTSVGAVVQQALDLGNGCSGISLKDSLITTSRLCAIGDCIKGRVGWAACTKLSHQLCDTDKLVRLRDNGLTTLEVGLESLLLQTQQLIGKVQSPRLFEEFVASVSCVPGLSLVVNYMTGFPWEVPSEAQEKFEEVRAILGRYLGVRDSDPGSRAKLEHNTFELERLAPMAKNPAKYGIQQDNLKIWPWASVIEHTRDIQEGGDRVI